MKLQILTLILLIVLASACKPSTSTSTSTSTFTPTSTATAIPTSTPTFTPTPTHTPTDTPTYTRTPTTILTPTLAPTPTLSQTPVETPTITESPTITPTNTLEITTTPIGELPHTSSQVGSEGGTMQLGLFQVTIPSGLLTQQVEISVREIPSQAAEVTKILDTNKFVVIGSAYEFTAPFFSNLPFGLTLTYDDGALPSGFEAQNLGVLLRTKSFPEEWVSTSKLPPLIDEVRFLPLPATVDTSTHQIQTRISTTGTFQVVALSQPLHVIEHATVPKSSPVQLANLQTPAMARFRFVWCGSQEPPQEFQDEVFSTLQTAYEVLVLQKGFIAPSAPVTVYFDYSSEHPGYVARDNPLGIVINPSLFDRGSLVHEYFHVTQLWNSNPVSMENFYQNRWFLDGTADWAKDEVFDSSSYTATTGERFIEPLNKESKEGDLDPYQTIAFWKWLETKEQGSIKRIMEHHRSLTSILISDSVRIVDPFTKALYLDSLLDLYPGISFRDYAVAALYEKDFDQNEIGTQDIWGQNNLGQPRNVPKYFSGQRGEISDVTAPKEIPYKVANYLTADVRTLRNIDCGTAGSGGETLQLAFPQLRPQDPLLEIAVVSPSTNQINYKTLSPSTETVLEIPFPPGALAYVIIVDPRCNPASFESSSGSITASIKKPAGYTPGKATVVNTVESMLDALQTVGSGNIVRLAPGTYYVPGRMWTGGPLGNWPASLVIWEGVTLTGSGTTGSDQTTLVLTGQNSGITGLDRATLRNIQVVAQWPQGVNTVSAHRFSMCNVWLEGNRVNDGLDFMVDDGSHFDLQVQDSTFVCTSHTAGCAGGSGIVVRGYIPTNMTPGTVTVAVHGTLTRGWNTGMTIYASESDPQAILDLDCAELLGEWRNVWIEQYPYSFERCPAKP